MRGASFLLFALCVAMSDAVGNASNVCADAVAAVERDPRSLIELLGYSGTPKNFGRPADCNLVDGSHWCLVDLLGKVPWGLCVPEECDAESLSHVIADLMALPVEARYCWPGSDDPHPFASTQWYTGGIVVVVVFSLVTLFGLCVTAVDYYRRLTLHERDDGLDEAGGEDGEDRRLLPSSDAINAAPHIIPSAAPKQQPARESWISCFDWNRGYEGLMRATPPILRIFDGCRTLAILWIALGHVKSFNDPVFASSQVLKQAPDTAWGAFALTFIATNLRSVDTFFFMSGCLAGFLKAKSIIRGETLDFKGILLLLLRRALRIWPVYLVWLLVWWFIVPITLGAPIAFSYQEQMEYCNRYWWTNLLFISNLYPAQYSQMCFGWGWYLSADFQFFVFLAPLFLLLYQRLVKYYGWSLISYALVSVVPLTLLPVLYRLVFLISHNDIGYLGGNYMTSIYGKPYSRMAPFAIGIFTGIVIAEKRKIQLLRSRPVRYALHVLCLLGVIACAAPLYWIDVISQGAPRALFVASVALFPLLWSLSLSWLALSCASGFGPPLVSNFLSLPVFAPLGRLGLSVYLLHPLVIASRLYNLLELPVFSFSFLFDEWVVVSVISYAGAFASFFIFEYPMALLFRRLIPKRK